MVYALRIFAATALAAAVLAAPACATVLVNQPYSASKGGTVSSLAGSGYIRTFDDFVLSANDTITTVSFYGAAGAAGKQFQIGFATALAGAPYYPDLTTLTYQTVKPTQTGTFGSDASYEVVLPTAVALTGGVTYWLTIYNTQSYYWTWDGSDGTGATGPQPTKAASYVASNGSPHMVLQTGNQAFTLQGAPTVVPHVPEPATLALFGAGLGLLRRCKRRNA